ncbi:MAG TPA: lytic transglycosylase domain-containing protein [Chitinophagaceae bacterium]|nr:lytic transglycosylase domain-containing protein [Chitinophagaceae bacterium]
MKRKLTKKVLIGNGLLLLIALVSVAARQVGSSSSNDSSTQPLSFDTVLLKLNGASETDLLNAPCISLNNHAASYVKKYLANNSEDLQAIKSKSASYFKITDAVFSKYGLPQELKYLAVVESELNTKALSHVGARGAWQLMPETARLLSLKITRKNDERTHFFKSTVAAAKYLRDLHVIFDDWLLVIASYNSGPGRVMDAIKKSGSRNFWKLQNFLPEETRGHVKRFVATHYFFEGKGSVTTVTRAEAIAYKKTMLAFVEGQKALREKQAPATEIANNKTSVNNDVVVKVEVPVDSKTANRE